MYHVSPNRIAVPSEISDLSHPSWKMFAASDLYLIIVKNLKTFQPFLQPSVSPWWGLIQIRLGGRKMFESDSIWDPGHVTLCTDHFLQHSGNDGDPKFASCKMVPWWVPVEAVHSLNGFAPSRWTEDPWTNLITKHLANSSWVRSCDCCVCIVCIFYQGNFLQNQMRRRQDHKVNGNAHVQKIYPNNSKYSLHMFAEYVYILSIVLSIVFVQIALPATQTGSWKFEIFWHQRRYESRCTE